MYVFKPIYIYLYIICIHICIHIFIHDDAYCLIPIAYCLLRTAYYHTASTGTGRGSTPTRLAPVPCTALGDHLITTGRIPMYYASREFTREYQHGIPIYILYIY